MAGTKVLSRGKEGQVQPLTLASGRLHSSPYFPSSRGSPWHPTALARLPAVAAAPTGREEGEGEYIKQNDCNNKKPSCRRCKNVIGLKAADIAESINTGSRLFIAHRDAEVQKNRLMGQEGKGDRQSPPRKGINAPLRSGRGDGMRVPSGLMPLWGTFPGTRCHHPHPSVGSCRVQGDRRVGAAGVSPRQGLVRSKVG